MGTVRYGTVRIHGQPVSGSILKRTKDWYGLCFTTSFEFFLIGYILVLKKNKLRREVKETEYGI
jgi:hypothetical protein